MQHKHNVAAVDAILQDILKQSDTLFEDVLMPWEMILHRHVQLFQGETECKQYKPVYAKLPFGSI